MPIKVSVNSNGRMTLPSDILEHLSLAGGGTLLLDKAEDGFILRTIPQAIAHVQTLAKQFTASRPEVSVDAFLARRREDSGQ